MRIVRSGKWIDFIWNRKKEILGFDRKEWGVTFGRVSVEWRWDSKATVKLKEEEE